MRILFFYEFLCGEGGKGKDNVTLSAGLVNRIDTGKDSDTVVIKGGRYNYISSSFI